MPLSDKSKQRAKQKLVTATKSNCIEIYSPDNMLNSPALAKAMHPAAVLEIEVPSLGLLKKSQGEKKIQALIKLHLVNLNEILNLANPLTERQIDLIASQTTAIHSNLTLVDIHIICKRAMCGYYGELYERLNTAKVLRWFADYFEERCNSAEEASYEAHCQIKESRHDTRSSEELAAKEHITKLGAWILKKHVKR